MAGKRDRSVHPPYLFPDYASTILRAPARPLLPVKEALRQLRTPVFGEAAVGSLDNDLTKNGRKNGEPIGERIKVFGKVTDENGQGIPNVLIEIWQANAAGRYIHRLEIHDAPLDPNFLGGGRTLSGQDGGYVFYTVKPGAYPWGNHYNAWRPNHIHFSLIGPRLEQRLVTQMYFPGDPLLAYDPIFQGTPEKARSLLISHFNIHETEAEFALAFQFDIVLIGSRSTPFE